LDQQQIEPSGGYDTEQIQEKIGWLNEYRDQLSDWQKLRQLIINNPPNQTGLG
jgi:hypothetical protein